MRVSFELDLDRNIDYRRKLIEYCYYQEKLEYAVGSDSIAYYSSLAKQARLELDHIEAIELNLLFDSGLDSYYINKYEYRVRY